MKRKLVITIVIIALAMTLLSGCAKKEVTLESFVNDNPSEKESLEVLTAEDPNASIEFEGNVMRIIYKVEDSTVTKEILDPAMEMMRDTFSGIAKDLASGTGIEGIQIEIVYQDASGKEITKRTFE
ncbi:MAG: DUF4854 domain-containing protein [Firmicutes bacterium]|nr:DUF4854 domain-containing protein [Bacillota bacterium]